MQTFLNRYGKILIVTLDVAKINKKKTQYNIP